MSDIARPLAEPLPPLRRLSSLVELDDRALAALRSAQRQVQRFAARREIVAEGDTVRCARAVIGGWACRQTILGDGRRQIHGFILPGDLIGTRFRSDPMASTSIFAITDLAICTLPTAAPGTSLALAYARADDLDWRYTLAQVIRLGQLDARERVANLVLEFRDRLLLAGLGSDGQIPLPATQEMLADALGITAVHVNRMLQRLKHDGLLTVRGSSASLLDTVGLEEAGLYRPVAIAS